MAQTMAAIPVFVAVVDGNSFTAAADRLGVTKSAVSRRIAELEEDLGVRLLHRTTRKLSLTEAGDRYLEFARRSLQEARLAEDAATALQDLPRGRLRINTPMSFGRLHVAPTIPAFLARYPDVEVEMTMDDKFVDIVGGGYDLAIRVGRLADSTLVARKLAPNHTVLCASPDYLASHPAPVTPEDLLDHNCLRYSYYSEAGEWTLLRGDEAQHVRVTGNYQVNNSEALREALVRGCGIGRIPRFIVDPDLAAGRLRCVLSEYDLPAQDIYAVWPERAYLPRKVRVFVDFLAEQGWAPFWDVERDRR
ncbi:MAG: LysR substrate-binding domain-containing protein [Myxococcota bacterium]